MARRARVLHVCIALAPACTFHGGTCFGKGRSHFVIAFLPLLPFPSHPKENQATYSSSTRATDLRQLRDLCKPFSLSLSLSRLNYFPRSSLYLYEYLTPSSPFFNLPTPFSFEIIAGSEKEREIYKIEIARFCFRETRGKDRTRDIRLDFLGSRGCGKLLLRAVVGRLERRK